jgi:hypothetical protein
MRHFYTAVLERMRNHAADFDTEPYEAGWAGEAMFFFRIHDIRGEGVRLTSRVQVSVDGIDWVDEGTAFPPLERPGSTCVKVRHFGGWLRLHTEIRGADPVVNLTIQLALKE